eukprot:TRINITY_DN51292_c0_g1_i1.p1 TRINITY_DN51292_c0_g1~~TRINITY_DN51292_c0_g1_i1.p1  ORF type:complete len:295 (-),score=71.02 TRINITY_DN51292_c0_g1_i1:129-1013(-)
MAVGAVAAGLVAVVAVAAASLLALLRTTELPDRLSAIPETATAIDNVGSYDSTEKWSPDGLQAGLYLMNPWRLAIFEANIAAFNASGPQRVVDIGCGAGLVAAGLARRGHAVIGLDASEEALVVARGTAAAESLDVSYVGASAYALPLDDGVADVVVMSDVLEHFHDVPLALQEASRVLRPGGLFLFDTIDRSVFSYLAAIFVGERLLNMPPRGSHDWRLFITPAETQRALQLANFSEVHCSRFDPSPKMLAGMVLTAAGLRSSRDPILGSWDTGEVNKVLSMNYIGSARRRED